MTDSILEQISHFLCREAPSFEVLLKKYGDMAFRDITGIALNSQTDLSDPLKAAVLDAASRNYDADTVAGLREQLAQKPVFNTAEHFGYSNSFLLHSSIFTANLEKARSLPYTIVLACSNISFKDPSQPATIAWKGESTRLVPVKSLRCSIYTAPPINRARWADVHEDFRGMIDYDALPATGFMEQMGRINTILWAQAFCKDSGFPGLIYLSLEEVAAQLIIASLARRDEIAEFCLEPERLRMLLDVFDGLPYCWEEANKGTHLFWYDVAGKAKYPLRFDGDRHLTGKDVRIELNADEIIEKLRDKTLIPGSFLSYLTLLLHNARIFGGPLQIQVMPEIWRRWCGLTGMDHHTSISNESQMSMFTLLFNRQFAPLNFDDIIALPAEKRPPMFAQMMQAYDRLTPKDLLALFAFPAIITQKKGPHPFEHLREYGDPRVVAELLKLDERIGIHI
ncbi:MAG: hypothetical protein MI802_13380 [Desulfobacterales bacterium]|nr:hypothetical protein [Desulfobacterales bacterium]